MTEFELLLKVAHLVATDDGNGGWVYPEENLRDISALLQRNQIGVNDR